MSVLAKFIVIEGLEGAGKSSAITLFGILLRSTLGKHLFVPESPEVHRSLNGSVI